MIYDGILRMREGVGKPKQTQQQQQQKQRLRYNSRRTHRRHSPRETAPSPPAATSASPFFRATTAPSGGSTSGPSGGGKISVPRRSDAFLAAELEAVVAVEIVFLFLLHDCFRWASTSDRGDGGRYAEAAELAADAPGHVEGAQERMIQSRREQGARARAGSGDDLRGCGDGRGTLGTHCC